MYGGMPGGGGFSANHELEIGMQNVAEAAHCILGSLGKNLQGRSDWETMKRIEHEHLREELHLILKYSKEYARDLYLERINQDLQSNTTVKTIDSIGKAAPQLESKAKQMRMWLQAQKDVPQPVMEAATAAYDLLIVLAQAGQLLIKPYPEPLTHNPFRNRRYVKATRTLRARIHALYGMRYREHTAPRDKRAEQYIRKQRQQKREREENEQRMREFEERYGKPEPRKPRERTEEDERQTQELMDLLSGL